ncbi:hypothetical protein [Priestia koreensis]|uniref:hypothetical protein n=2 Tax=Priestia koreensis TaxID=284581 RepID=UPI00203A8404|nr:hypothetical protein [Priestia koreensis]MCM3005673.1 hypothetical protein [Priestia koreensis]
MIFNLEIKFEQLPPNVADDIRTGEIYYSLFDTIIFWVNKKNFFEHANGIPEEVMGGSSISSDGLAIPIYGFIQTVINDLDDIGKEKTIIIYEDQIDKEIVVEASGENVILAIRYCLSNYWYDGESVKESLEIPISSVNTIPITVFKEGMIEGIRTYFESLLQQFPELKKVNKFVELYKKVKK